MSDQYDPRPDFQTAQERQQQASDLAYAQGVRDAEVRSHLQAHERRFAMINGSIDRLNASVEHLHTVIAAMSSAQASRDAVQAALKESVDDANDRQVTTRTFVLGLCGLMVAIAVLVLSVAL